MWDWLVPGAVFDTDFDGVIIEEGCVVATVPDQWGSFTAYDSDNVLCTFNVCMVVPKREV